MGTLTKNHTEAEIVAMQWAKCIEKAYKDLKNIESDRVHIIKYEEFVKTPLKSITTLFNFVGIDTNTNEIKLLMDEIQCADIGKETASPDMELVKGISDKSIGRWKKQLDTKTINSITPLIENAMQELGYS